MLLRSDAGQAHRGMVAKVADFGLSVAVDQAQTHVSAMRQVCVRRWGREDLYVDQAQTHVSAMRQVCVRRWGREDLYVDLAQTHVSAMRQVWGVCGVVGVWVEAGRRSPGTGPC